MTHDPHDILVRLELGERRCNVSPLELADALGLAVDGVVHTLATLLAMSTPALGGKGALGDEGASRQEVTNGTNEGFEYADAVPSFVDSEGEGSAREEGERARLLALQLADRLDDHGSLPFFKHVAAVVPEDVVRICLDRALALRRVHRSRGAYFTALVRPHLDR
jgi:hypothetical protein